MKQIFPFLLATLLVTPGLLRAQDAAVEERLNQLNAKIQDLVDAREAQNRKIDDLARQIRDLQDRVGRPDANAASQDDVRQLAAKLQEVDRKRQEDNEQVLRELRKLGHNLTAPPPSQPVPPAPSGPSKGYEYEVQSGDTLSAIVQAYRDQKNIKVTIDDILKANPGLDPKKMRVGQKIFIPAPQ